MLCKSISSTLAVALLATSAFAGAIGTSDAGIRDRAKPRAASTIVMTAAVKKTQTNVAEMSFMIDKSMRAKLNTLQWTMAAGSVGRPVLSGNQYRLVNSVTESGLKRQKRTVAANLGWLSRDSKAFNVRIKR